MCLLQWNLDLYGKLQTGDIPDKQNKRLIEQIDSDIAYIVYIYPFYRLEHHLILLIGFFLSGTSFQTLAVSF